MVVSRQAHSELRVPFPPTASSHAAGLGAIVVAGAAAALAIGYLATVQPLLALAGAAAIALVPLVITRPIVGVVALVFLSFLEEYAGKTGTLSVTKLLGGLLVGAWLVVVATRSSAAGPSLVRREPMLVVALVAFVAWAAISIAWAQVPDAGQNSVQRYALNFLLFPVAMLAIRVPRHVLWVVGAFVAGTFAAVVLGLREGLGESGRLNGAGINPNQLGSYLTVTIVFLTTFAAVRTWSGAARMLALAGAALASLALFLTLSRGALLGLVVALFLAPFVVGRGRRLGAFAIAVVAVAGTVVWFGALAPADHVERITHPERGGGSGRTDLWKIGWRIVEDRPVAGVGAGNYPEASADYLLRPGATDNDTFIVDDKKVAHNIYLTVATELGVVGLLLFLAIVAICLRSALRAARAFEARGDPVMELVSRALFLALVSLLAVGFFSSALYVKQFWILLAAAPVLHALADAEGAVRLSPRRVRALRERARAAG